MSKNISAIYALGLSMLPVLAHAAPAPTLGDVLSASGISVTGYLDSSYNYLSGSGFFTNGTGGFGTQDRVFDYQHNSFNVNMIDLTAQSKPSTGFGGLFEINAGSDAAVIAPYPYYSGISYNGGHGHQFDVQQAYMQYATGPLTVMAGKFVTLAGAEVITSPEDVNFSRSILFGYAIPFTHTGVRAIYTVNPSVSLTFGVNNGWDQVTTPMGPKTVELGTTITPVKPLTVTADYYEGREYVLEPASNMTTGAAGDRKLLDLVAVYTVTTPLTVTLNYDTASQDNYDGLGHRAKWDGLAGYVTYQFTTKWQGTVRAEYFNDPQGYRTGVDVGTGGQKWKEATLTVAYLPTPSVILRGELREDKSNVAAFAETNGATTDTQHSIGVEAIYKF